MLKPIRANACNFLINQDKTKVSIVLLVFPRLASVAFFLRLTPCARLLCFARVACFALRAYWFIMSFGLM